ncbi:MAG: IS5 family transposase, partial [Candidatus Macondimonas sp.]
MKQRSLSETRFDRRPKATKRQRFLSEMDAVIPWARLMVLVDPVQPKRSGKGGRKAFSAETMLRIHFMQQWFALSDPAMEEALHDVLVMRQFAGLDAGDDLIPDESSILRFRHRLEAHGVADQLLSEVNAVLVEQGLMLKAGTIVDATLIHAPSSTKNSSGLRDPEMHQTKKGNNWYFGCKAHIGVDAESGLTHTVVTTPANVNDVTQAHACLQGEETEVFGDAGYQG